MSQNENLNQHHCQSLTREGLRDMRAHRLREGVGCVALLLHLRHLGFELLVERGRLFLLALALGLHRRRQGGLRGVDWGRAWGDERVEK